MTPKDKYALLRARGLKVHQIAGLCGCSVDTLERLAKGRYIHRRTEERLMAIRLPRMRAKGAE